MKDLLEAIKIFLKYGNPDRPFNCTHDTLVVWGIPPCTVSKADIKRLDQLGFFVSDDDGEECFKSFKYGSC